jgi:hypothetical protein
MKFLQYITEKLQPSQFREIMKMWKASNIASRYDKLFDGGKDRIYFPFKFSQKDLDTLENPIKRNIDNTLKYANKTFNVDYEIKNYRLGLVINKKNDREIKIVKILDNLEKKYVELSKENKSYIGFVNKIEKLKKDFINDKDRSLKGDIKYLICISRHAYDIAGMSTDRGWTSCQNINIKTY